MAITKLAAAWLALHLFLPLAAANIGGITLWLEGTHLASMLTGAGLPRRTYVSMSVTSLALLLVVWPVGLALRPSSVCCYCQAHSITA